MKPRLIPKAQAGIQVLSADTLWQYKKNPKTDEYSLTNINQKNPVTIPSLEKFLISTNKGVNTYGYTGEFMNKRDSIIGVIEKYINLNRIRLERPQQVEAPRGGVHLIQVYNLPGLKL